MSSKKLANEDPASDSGESAKSNTTDTCKTKRRRSSDGSGDMMAEMRRMFAEWSTRQGANQAANFTALEKKLDDVIASIDFVSKQHDELNAKIDRMEKARKDHLIQIQTLEKKVENFERMIKSTSIEIRNIPVPNKENKKDLVNTVLKLGSTLDLQLETRDIKDIFRVNTKSLSNKPVIVDFASVLVKEDVIQATKKFNKANKDNMLSTANIGIQGPAQPIFVGESLTAKNKRLFFLARGFAKANKFKYCWSSYGKIYLKESDSHSSTLIDSESDITKLKKQPSIPEQQIMSEQ